MKTVLVTGAARRGGSAISRKVHERGYNVILHCRESSLQQATILAKELNRIRENSAIVWSADLNADIPSPPSISTICGIVACASEYVSSGLQLGELGGETFQQRLEMDLQTHVKGHLALFAHCIDYLNRNQGSVVAITDIHVERPHLGYLAYHVAKGALSSAIRSLAVQYSPVRFNCVAPGSFEWPQGWDVEESRKENVLKSIPLGRIGSFEEMATAVCFLLFDATYTTGTTLNVDGGRSIFLE
jgi:pteridine reductase